jgi:ArsR family transcriptional regulator, nickel/cobalt-responsive transcriptional repressor
MSRRHEVDLAHLSSEAADEVADTMQALAASSRVRILSRLTAGPLSVNELARAVEMEQPAVSQQLRVLRDLGLVVGKRQGRKTMYKLHDTHVAVLLAEAVAHAEHRRGRR